MYAFEFDLNKPVSYALTGKFEAPNPQWVHKEFPLEDYELFVMTKDLLHISYNEEKFTIREGEFLLLPPMPPPYNRRKGFAPSNCSFYWLHFTVDHPMRAKSIPNAEHSSYPYPMDKNMISLPRIGQIPHVEKVVVLMRQLQDAIRNHHETVSINYLTSAILCALYSQLCEGLVVVPEAKKTQKQMYYDIIDYVKLNTNRNLKVADVAEHFRYNEKYLSHLFSNIAGIPLKQFILNIKMDAANLMLTDTNASIHEIAQSLGFSDSHNFAKAYKKIAGLTPTEYRNAFSKRLLYHS